MLEISTEFCTFKKILNIFYHNSICIKIYNFFVLCHVKYFKLGVNTPKSLWPNLIRIHQ
uniref:Hexosyltransferase n=1 Tax=Rhizophora mucronata TaxID=61149 RepID=A0A2P2LMX2_RHIMU